MAETQTASAMAREIAEIPAAAGDRKSVV